MKSILGIKKIFDPYIVHDTKSSDDEEVTGSNKIVLLFSVLLEGM
jgi:hypothetical protein